jgi:hypothetical protein
MRDSPDASGASSSTIRSLMGKQNNSTYVKTNSGSDPEFRQLSQRTIAAPQAQG